MVFKYKAEAYRDYLIKQGESASSVKVIDGRYVENWNNALKENSGNISNIVYYGHSGAYGLYLRDMTPDDTSDNGDANLLTILSSDNQGHSSLQSYDNGEKDIWASDIKWDNAKGATLDILGCSSHGFAQEVGYYLYDPRKGTGGANGYNGSVGYKKVKKSGTRVQFEAKGNKVCYRVFETECK